MFVIGFFFFVFGLTGMLLLEGEHDILALAVITLTMVGIGLMVGAAVGHAVWAIVKWLT